MCTHPHNVYPIAGAHDGPKRPWPHDVSELSRCMALVLGVFALLGAAAFGPKVPWAGVVFSSAAMVLQLWAPLQRADQLNHSTASLGLNAHRWRRQAATVVALACLLVPLWAVGLHVAQPMWHVLGIVPSVSASWSFFGAAHVVASQVLGVALPEELFWRGYVQPVLEARAGPTVDLLGAPTNWGTIQATLLFALGHVVGGAGLLSLGTLFPGLVFAFLRNRDRSILGAVALHACCNVAAAALTA